MKSFLGVIKNSDQSWIYAASDFFTTWQKIKSIFRVSSHTEAPAQGLRIHCALIFLAKTARKTCLLPRWRDTSCKWEWLICGDCRRKWLKKASAHAGHSSSMPFNYQSHIYRRTESYPPSEVSCPQHFRTLPLSALFCLSPVCNDLYPQDLEEKDPLSSLPPIYRVMGGSS